MLCTHEFHNHNIFPKPRKPTTLDFKYVDYIEKNSWVVFLCDIKRIDFAKKRGIKRQKQRLQYFGILLALQMRLHTYERTRVYINPSADIAEKTRIV
jgi:hypothetical protein